MVHSDITLHSSFRIAFAMKIYSLPTTTTNHGIFKLTDIQHVHNDQQYPGLYLTNTNFNVYFNRCFNNKQAGWQSSVHIKYQYDLKTSQYYALTIEYVREQNRLYFYINGDEIAPHEPTYKHMNPVSVCYGIPARLFINDFLHAPVNGEITNFIYEQNVSHQPLGGLNLIDLSNGVCA